MSVPPPVSHDHGTDGCAELRAAVGTLCEQAQRRKQARELAAERLRELRRDLVTAERQRATTEAAADPELRTAEKARAREAYERAMAAAEGEDAIAGATASWARAIDRINRSGRLADRAVRKARTAVQRLGEAVRQAERDEQTARIQAEQAEATCLDARVRLATCEERARDGAAERTATVFEPHAATGGHAVAIVASETSEPLVIESMVSGDGAALDLAATSIVEQTGLAPAQARLQLQELVDAIVSSASTDGFLLFDPGNHFWSALSFEEGRDVISALARLGFQLEPAEGWHAGRTPSPMDLSMALAYAGLDARNMRDLPSAEELRELPRSISVDARGYLATYAPNLTVDDVVRLLGRRAAGLEPLWDEWGQVRPILLSPRRTLGSSIG